MALTTDQILDLYRSGSYGTPDAPVRSSSVKSTFWLVYFGHRKASDFKNNIHHAAATAGAKAARQQRIKT
jgi:hypothetical protein